MLKGFERKRFRESTFETGGTANVETRQGTMSRPAEKANQYHGSGSAKDGALQLPPVAIEKGERWESRKLYKSELILKILIYCLYGIFPGLVNSGRSSDWYLVPAVVVTTGQWFAVGEYIYVIARFWKSERFQNISSNNDCADPYMRCYTANYMTVIPTETVVLLMGLVFSGAITVVLGTIFFRENFRRTPVNGWRRFDLIPDMQDDPFEQAENRLSDGDGTDWLHTNMLLAVGFLILGFSIFTDQAFNTYFDFVGIHNFLCVKGERAPSGRQKVMYYTALVMLFWGYGATICACCLFHAMAMRIKQRVSYTERVVLNNVCTKEEFLWHTNKLISYKKQMISRFKLWFTSHNVMFVILLAAMIYEWIEVLQQKGRSIPAECLPNLIVSQVSGTMIICYEFAFPILSASLVTDRFSKYFKNVAFSSTIKDMHATDILALAQHSGFDVLFIRVTPKVALLIFGSCFAGILKIATQGG